MEKEEKMSLISLLRTNKYDLSCLDDMACSLVQMLSLALIAKKMESGGSCCMYLSTCLSPKLTHGPIMASLAGE